MSLTASVRHGHGHGHAVGENNSSNNNESSNINSNYNDTSFDDLTKSLADNFAVLADEVQLLSDRKTILEHKLRFAHEQLADKYAPNNSEIAHILAALHLPPDPQIQAPDRATFVPLPLRKPAGSKQQAAEAIRDGRKVSRLIARLKGWVPASASDRGDRSTIQSTISTMRTSHRATPTTTLEQDFTVPGKLSKLDCPFTTMANTPQPPNQPQDDTPHQSKDPICAAMYSENHSSAPPSLNGAPKCPIRYLNQHSPEEVAKYFETHKHEIPRSHQVCVNRYQRSEEDVRKLDAKYGNVVSMIQGLGAKHQPMLPTEDGEHDPRVSDAKSNERVESWADEVNGASGNEADAEESEDNREDEERQGRFDRPLREIRVGESPSRPWGIPVPYIETPAFEPQEFARPVSPFAAPLPTIGETNADAKPATAHIARCPFPAVGDQGAAVSKLQEDRQTNGRPRVPSVPQPQVVDERPPGKCPYDPSSMPQMKLPPTTRPILPMRNPPAGKETYHPAQEQQDPRRQPPTPVFLKPNDISQPTPSSTTPQVVFNGPVFIGYSPEQAIEFMKLWQK